LEKTLIIDNKPVRFKCSASFVFKYRGYIKKDIFDVIMPLITSIMPLMLKGEANRINGTWEESQEIINNGEGFNFTDLYEITWVLAKTADPTIPEVEEWLDSFNTFPMVDIFPEIIALLTPTLLTKAKPKKKKKQNFKKHQAK